MDQISSALPYERHVSGDRKYDAAQLLLVEPLQVLEGGAALTVVRDATRHLMRQHGFVRYEGDTYWGPRFTAILALGEQTTSAPGRLEALAEGIGYSGTEARWTLFDPSPYIGANNTRYAPPEHIIRPICSTMVDHFRSL